jgi:hypothetical protein
MSPGKLNHFVFWKACFNRFAIERNLRRELSVAEAAEGVLAERLRELKTRFDQTYPNAEPARLYVHRTGRSLALRWRLAADRRQAHDFFELRHDKSPGREVLDALPKSRRDRYLKFAADAMTLNVAYAVYRYERDRLLDHLRKLRTLGDTLACYQANPIGVEEGPGSDS